MLLSPPALNQSNKGKHVVLCIYTMCATVLIALQKHISNSIVSQKQKHNPQRHLLDMQGEEGEEEQELGGGGGGEGEGGEGEEEGAEEEHRRQLQT